MKTIKPETCKRNQKREQCTERQMNKLVERGMLASANRSICQGCSKQRVQKHGNQFATFMTRLLCAQLSFLMVSESTNV
jgi:hypothetical protein